MKRLKGRTSTGRTLHISLAEGGNGAMRLKIKKERGLLLKCQRERGGLNDPISKTTNEEREGGGL